MARKGVQKNGLEHGIFSDPTYISVGEPYGKKTPMRKPGADASAPKPMVVLKGGSLFEDKPPRVFKGEAYYDKFKHERIEAARSKKLQMTYKFTPSGAGKETFSGPIPYFKPGDKASKPRKKELPNFYTRPGPKGSGAGYADVTLSKLPPHVPEKYLTPYERQLRDAKASRAKMKGEAFRPVGGNSTGTFDANPYAPFEPPKRRRQRTRSAPAKPVVPFRPTTSMSTRAVPGKSSHQHLFSAFNHKADPYQDRAKTAGADKKKKPIGPAFRPNPPSKTTFTRSISLMNATRSIKGPGPK